MLEPAWKSKRSNSSTMEDRSERRREARRPASYPTTITVIGEEATVEQAAVVRNINSRGALFSARAALPKEQAVQLHIALDRSLAGQNRAIQIMAVGRVVRCSEDPQSSGSFDTAVEFVRPLTLSLEADDGN